MTANASLQQTLTLEQIDSVSFIGRSRGGTPVNVFGGEVAAQALVAAGRTVADDRRVHSLHGYFLRPGDPVLPLHYAVDLIRDGGTFNTRRVVATQNGLAVFTLTASFHRGAEGFEHQLAVLDAPDPESLPRAADVLKESTGRERDLVRLLLDQFPLDVRFPEELPGSEVQSGERGIPWQRVWLRSSYPLPDDPLLHAGAATYLSDLFLLAAALRPHRPEIAGAPVQVFSLDHAVWFHAPFRADEWLLYEQEGSRASSGRALARGTLLNQAGLHVATVMQEGLLRLATPPPAST